MEVTFLGTGTSDGVPVINPVSSDIDLTNKKNWRTRSSIHVEMDGYHVQVDAAQEFRLQCLWNDITTIDLFILTHGHADHILGMDDLRRFCQPDPLDVYSTEEGLGRIRSVFPYALLEERVSPSYPAFNLNLMPSVLDTPGGRVQSFHLPHGSMDTLGLVFQEKSTGKQLTYFSDCKRVPEAAQEAAKGSDVVVLDGLRPSKPHPTHMIIPEAIEVAKEIGAPVNYLTHTTMHVDYDRVSDGLPEAIHLAYDGLKLQL